MKGDEKDDRKNYNKQKIINKRRKKFLFTKLKQYDNI